MDQSKRKISFNFYSHIKPIYTMAKSKRKKHHRMHIRRRKMGAIDGDTTKTIAGAVIGAIGARMIANNVATSIDPKIKNLVMLAGGAFLTMKAKNPMLKGAGLGIAASAAITEGQAFGLISGIGEIPNYASNRQLADASRVAVVGNFPQPGVVGGFPDINVVGGMM
jgi:hypothetical protein